MIYILFMHLNINVNDIVYDEKFKFVVFFLTLITAQRELLYDCRNLVDE